MANEMSLEEKWEKAWLENNFIFYHVFHNNPDLCKMLLEILLKIEIDHIEMHNEEMKTIKQIAEELGIVRISLMRVCKKYGIK